MKLEQSIHDTHARPCNIWRRWKSDWVVMDSMLGRYMNRIAKDKRNSRVIVSMTAATPLLRPRRTTLACFQRNHRKVYQKALQNQQCVDCILFTLMLSRSTPHTTYADNIASDLPFPSYSIFVRVNLLKYVMINFNFFKNIKQDFCDMIRFR